MADEAVCVVCGDTVDTTNSSVCHACGGRFHLNQRNDWNDRDCGSVWINDQFLALEFACQSCLDGAEPQPPPRSIIRRPRTGRKRYRKRA